MDPIIKWIYIAYAYQDKYSIVGIPENAKLASALQMMAHQTSATLYDQLNPIKAHDFVIINMALKLVRKYSTCENL